MNSLLRVLSYLKPFRMLAAVTFVCAGLATALELIPPYLVKVIIDDVIQSKHPEMLPGVLGALLGSYVLRNLVSSMRVRFNNLLEQKAVHALRMQVFGALQRLSLSYFENRSTGEIMTRVTSDTEHVERIFVDGLEGLLTASLTLIGITIMLFVLNWKLALLSLVPIPILSSAPGGLPVVCMAITRRCARAWQSSMRTFRMLCPGSKKRSVSISMRMNGTDSRH